METYCVSCNKTTESKKSSVRWIKKDRITFLSNCVVCGRKKLNFIKNKKFHNFNDLFKLDKVIKNFLLNGDKFIPELDLKQTRCTYSASGPFIKQWGGIQKFRETCNLKHLYRNELDEVCFYPEAAYSDIKNLAKRTISDNILKDRGYEIVRNHKYDGYQRALASMIYKFLDKETRQGKQGWVQITTSWKIT